MHKKGICPYYSTCHKTSQSFFYTQLDDTRMRRKTGENGILSMENTVPLPRKPSQQRAPKEVRN